MTHDIPWAFRQESNFNYLTGLQDPDCVMLLAKPPAGPPLYVLAVPPSDPDHDLWHGPRTDCRTAREHFGCDAALPTTDLKAAVGAALTHAGTPAEIHFLSGVNDKLERSLSEALVHHNVRSYTPAGPLLQQIRRHKSSSDIAMFQRAADISDAMFRSAMRATTAGLSEHHIFNVLEFEARLRGAERLAYPPVVAGGANGLSLHYINNNQLLRSGDLLLVDAGAEYHHYTSDVTRTWPVDGRFTPAQRIVYEAVLMSTSGSSPPTPAPPSPSARSTTSLCASWWRSCLTSGC
jgi:Xaa-Pro aminopeptidase